MSNHETLEKRRMRGLAVLAAIIATNTTFFQGVWSGAQAFWFRDSIIGFMPTKLYMRERLLSGEWPLWTDRIKNGMPFWADPVNGVLYPVHTALLIFSDPLYAYGFLVIIHFALAHGGFYLWLRQFNLVRSAAFLGALSIAYGGALIQKHENLQFLFAWSWSGYYLAALHRFLKAPHWGWGAIAVSALLCVTLSGDIQTTYVLGLLTLVLSVAVVIRDRSFAGRLIGSAWILITTALLASPWLVPVYELSRETTRTTWNSLELVTQWSFHPFRWTEWLVPDLYGFTFRDDMPFWGNALTRSAYKGFYTSQSYFGVLLIPLAICGLWKCCKRSEIQLWAVLGLLTFLAACGDHTPFYGLLYKVLPFWSNFRFPERLLLWPMMAIALIAACGLHTILKSQKSSTRNLRLQIFLPTTMLLIAFLLWRLSASPEYLDPWISRIARDSATQELLSQVSRSLSFAAKLWSAGGLILFLIVLMGSRYRAIGWGAVLFTAVDLFLVNRPQAPAWDSAIYRTPPSLITRFLADFPREAHPDTAYARLFFNHERSGIHWAGEESSAVSQQIWDLVYGNVVLLTPYSTSIGYNSSELATMVRMLRGTHWRNYLALTGVNYWLVLPKTAESRKDWRCGIPDPVTSLVWCTDANQTAPVRCPSEWTRIDDPKQLASAYRITSFVNQANSALIGSFRSEPDRATPVGIQSGSGSAASVCGITRWDEDHRVIQIERANEGPVIIRDNFYPGWKAYSGDDQLPVFTANGGQIATWAPAGRRQIEIRFEPDSLREGVLLAALGLLINWFVAWREMAAGRAALDIRQKRP